MRSFVRVMFVLAGTLLPGVAVAQMPVRPCESLSSLMLPHGAVTLAAVVPKAGFSRAQVGASTLEQAFTNPAAMCRVAATLRPSIDSDIKIEVWLPLTDWNGKFQGLGNGGQWGLLNYPWMSEAIGQGYATASTDTGHEGNTASFAFGHPEKLIDYSYRSHHEMTIVAKAIVDAFYGTGPQFSIFNGCSAGGRQAISEASRYPTDYDAIVAGSSAVYKMQIDAARVALNVFVNRTPESYIPPEKYPAVHRAVVAACDASDGLKDGLVSNPAACHVDPQVLVCQAGETNDCLTPAQVATVRGLWAPISPTPSQNEFPSPLLLPGAELGWATLAGPEPIRNAADVLRYIVFQDPSWNWRTFNAKTDLSRAADATRSVDATDPDLRPFFSRGGKLLMYHGWADPQVSPYTSINYFSDVAKIAGADSVGRAVQLYMAPGMNHCRGGEGPDTFDFVAAMESWVRTGAAPAQVIGAHRTAGAVDRARPVCPYPQVAMYRGSGSIDDAANFSCAAAPSK